MHYQRWRRTGDPEKVRPAGRPRDEHSIELFERSKGQWSSRTITRYKRVEMLCEYLAADESGNVDPQRWTEELGHLRWVTSISGLKDNVAGMERMAFAVLLAKQAGCTDEEWAELERAALYPEDKLSKHRNRVNVTRLEDLLLSKLEDMVEERRLELDRKVVWDIKKEVPQEVVSFRKPGQDGWFAWPPKRNKLGRRP